MTNATLWKHAQEVGSEDATGGSADLAGIPIDAESEVDKRIGKEGELTKCHASAVSKSGIVSRGIR